MANKVGSVFVFVGFCFYGRLGTGLEIGRVFIWGIKMGRLLVGDWCAWLEKTLEEAISRLGVVFISVLFYLGI